MQIDKANGVRCPSGTSTALPTLYTDPISFHNRFSNAFSHSRTRRACPVAVGCTPCRLYTSFIVPRWHDIRVVALSYPAAWIVTSLAFIAYYFWGGWMERRIKKAQLYEKGSPTGCNIHPGETA